MPKSIFKKKFLGYSPSDVSGYIEKINAQAASEIESAERSAGKLREEKEKLRKENCELSMQLERITELEKTIIELQNEKKQLTEELENSKMLISAAEEKCIKLSDANGEKFEKLLKESEDKYLGLKAEYEALSLRYGSIVENENSYAKTCKDAGNILLIAQSKSEEVIEKAHKDAEILLAGAKINADEILTKASNEASQYSAKVKAEADEYSNKVRLEADAHVEQAKEKVDFLICRQKQLVAALQTQKSEISKFYDETVSGLDEESSN